MASVSRVAHRYLRAKYDRYAPKTFASVLETHLYTVRPGNEDDLNKDVTGKASGAAALLNRAHAWSFPAFLEYAEKYAFNENIEELQEDLEAHPLLYRVVQNGKTRVRGNTSEQEVRSGTLREHIEDYYKYERWFTKGGPWEIVTKPRPKADFRKLDNLIKERAKREKLWKAYYDKLRKPDPEIIEAHNTSEAINLLVQDHGVAVGGILVEATGTSTEKGRSILMANDACWQDIRTLAEKYGDGIVWTAVKSTLWPPYRRKGLGFALYLETASRLKNKPGGTQFLIPHGCWGSMGNTSPDANRVWKKLVRKFPSAGTVVAIP